MEDPTEEQIDYRGEEDQLNKSTIYYHDLKIANSYKFDKLDFVKEFEKTRNLACIILAKRRTGKTVLLKDLCEKSKKWYSQVYVFSMTVEYQEEMFDYVSQDNIYNSFNEEALNDIWEHQSKIIKQMKKAKVPDEKMPHVLIILDDVVSDPKVRNSEILKRMFVAGRHVKIGFYLLNQSFTEIPPCMRKNVDMAVSFYLDSENDRKAFVGQYMSTKSRRIGEMVFNNITKTQYQALIVLNLITDQDPQKTIRTYTASLKLPKFRMYKDEIDKPKAKMSIEMSKSLTPVFDIRMRP